MRRALGGGGCVSHTAGLKEHPWNTGEGRRAGGGKEELAPFSRRGSYNSRSGSLLCCARARTARGALESTVRVLICKSL